MNADFWPSRAPERPKTRAGITQITGPGRRKSSEPALSEALVFRFGVDQITAARPAGAL